MTIFNTIHQGFPGGSVVKNLPVNTAEMGLIPGRNIPHAAEQLSLCTTTTVKANIFGTFKYL